MIHFILTALWDSALAQFGIAGLTLAGAILVFLYAPSQGIRHLAVSVGSVCVVFLFLAPKLYFEGVSHEKEKWDAAIAADVKRGTDARSEAERAIPAITDVTPGPSTGFQRLNPFTRRVPDDRYDRDRTEGAVQRVAPNNVLRKPGHPANGTTGSRPQPGGQPVGVLGVIQPSGIYPCWQVKIGMATLSKKKIDELAKSVTPEQRAAAQKCLKK
jgi:hypothetical protein